MRESARKPLAQQKGTMNVVVMQQKQREEELVKTASDEILNPPDWLTNKVAREEWKRVIPQLLEINVVGNLDLANIAGYCNAYAGYREATEELNKVSLVYIDKADGKMKSNPYVNVQAQYAQEMRKFGDLCGMSISSRLKAATTKIKKEAERVEEKFGAI